MWITADGVAHTAALPNLQFAVGTGRDQLEKLNWTEKARLKALLFEYEDELLAELEGLTVAPVVEEGYVGAVPPPLNILLRRREAQLLDVVSSIAQADVRWRLDYLLVVQDACDDKPSASR